MKNVYLKTLNRLKTVPGLAYIAKDRGQIDTNHRPDVKFPCALISISLPNRETLGGKMQLCTCIINIRLAFQHISPDSNISTDTQLERALSYYDLIDNVENILQDYQDNEMTALQCISSIEEQREDIEVMKLAFRTTFRKVISSN